MGAEKGTICDRAFRAITMRGLSRSAAKSRTLDLRCSIEQDEQPYAALKLPGVPARFVRYPACTSHGMNRNRPPDLHIHRCAAEPSMVGTALSSIERFGSLPIAHRKACDSAQMQFSCSRPCCGAAPSYHSAWQRGTWGPFSSMAYASCWEQ